MKDIENATEDELAKLKVWLFQENIRIQAERQELEEQKKAFKREVNSVKAQMSNERRKLEFDRKECANQEYLIEEKWKLLKKGFEELDDDRKALKRYEKHLSDLKKNQDSMRNAAEQLGQVSIFFKGVTDTLSLKKRYRDLIKIFHPDNIAGDKDTVVSINREYDNLKERLE